MSNKSTSCDRSFIVDRKCEWQLNELSGEQSAVLIGAFRLREQ